MRPTQVFEFISYSTTQPGRAFTIDINTIHPLPPEVKFEFTDSLQDGGRLSTDDVHVAEGGCVQQERNVSPSPELVNHGWYSVQSNSKILARTTL